MPRPLAFGEQGSSPLLGDARSLVFGTRRVDKWATPAATAVVCGCMLAVRDGEVGSLELAVFRTINGLPEALHSPMWAFQLWGMVAVVGIAAAAALATRRTRLGLAIALAIPLKLAMEWWVVKAFVERERPALSVVDAVIRESNSAPLGFPSGHSVFAFALAGLLAPYLGRRGTLVVYSLAFLSGVARIYLGAHNPLDVVAGGALGVLIAAALNLAIGVPAARQAG